MRTEKDIVLSKITGISRLRVESDGPGIRTLIPLSGCPLHCRFCLNKPFQAEKMGKWYTPEGLYEEVRIDNLYFMASSGGVTFGGGEPALHSEFIRRFRDICSSSWSVMIQTSLNVHKEHIKRLIGIIDHWYIDIKDMNPATYKSYTGKSNTLVLLNLRYLIQQGEAEKITIRVPHIPQYNTCQDVKKSIEQLHSMGLKTEEFNYVIPTEKDDEKASETKSNSGGFTWRKLWRRNQRLQLMGFIDDINNDNDDWDW